MAASAPESSGLAAAVRQVAEHARALGRLHVALALRELRRKAGALAAGAALTGAAAVLGALALGAGLAAGVAALALVLPVWAALLVAAGGVLLLAGVLGLVGGVLLRRGAASIPRQALEEGRLTVEALRNGRR